MHIVLTDILTCPVCGPDFGLIVLARNIEDRRVLEGTLGCPNCERHYPIEGGLAQLAAGEPLKVGAAEPADAERAVRIAAFAALQEGWQRSGAGRAPSLLVGAPAGQAAELAALLPGTEFIAFADNLRESPEQPGVNRIMAGDRLPIGSGRLRAVVLHGGEAGALVAEAARVLSVAGRLIWLNAPEDAEATLADAGLQLLARDAVNLIAVPSFQ